MTETKAVMAQEEFEQHHARTWDYVARVGRIWESIAEEQQAIIDGKGYMYLSYGSWHAYWDGEFQAVTGWSAYTIKEWMRARRRKAETEEVLQEVHDRVLYQPSGSREWADLGGISDPVQRVKFLEEYVDLKPQLQKEGLASNKIFTEAIKGFNRERKIGVLERMQEEDVVVPVYPTGPTPEEQAYNAASQLLSVAMDVTPEAAADSVSPGLAQTTAQRYEALIPWTRRFVAQLHLRSSGGSGARAGGR